MGAFDDLVPQQATSGAFDDLVPKGKELGPAWPLQEGEAPPEPHQYEPEPGPAPEPKVPEELTRWLTPPMPLPSPLSIKPTVPSPVDVAPKVEPDWEREASTKEIISEPLVPLPTAPTIEQTPAKGWEKKLLQTSAEPGLKALAALVGDDVAIQTVREIYNQAKSVPEFFTSPMGVGTVMTGGLGRIPATAVTGYYTWDTLKSLVSHVEDTVANWGEMTPNEKARALVQAGGLVALGGMLTRGSARGVAGSLQRGAAKPKPSATAPGWDMMMENLRSFFTAPVEPIRKPALPIAPPQTPHAAPTPQQQQQLDEAIAKAEPILPQAAQAAREATPQPGATPTEAPAAEPSIPTPELPAAPDAQVRPSQEPIREPTTPLEPVKTQEPAPEKGPGMVGMGAADTLEIGTGAVEDVYGIRQATREARAAAGVGPETPPGQGISAPDSVEHGRSLLASGGDAEAAVAAFEKSKRLSSDDVALARAKGEELARAARRAEEEFGTDSPQFQAAQKASWDWDRRTKPMQTEWHKTGMAQQGETDIDTGTFFGLQRAYRDQTGKDFDPKQSFQAKRRVAAEKAAANAVWKTVRNWAAERAKLEAKGLTEDVKRQMATAAVEHEAAQKALDAANKTVRDAAARRAQAEAKAQAARSASDKAAAATERKASQQALDAANKAVRDAAAKAAEAERKALANPIQAVWERAGKYLESGLDNLDEIRHKVASDMGMSVDRVTRLMAQNPRMKYLTDEVWRKQQALRVMRANSRQWVRSLDIPSWEKALTAIPRAMFSLKVGFHGTVALGTHAPTVAFRPGFWNIYARDFVSMYKMSGSKAYFEREMQDLVRRQNYVRANRAGLQNDPFQYEEFQTPEAITEGTVKRAFNNMSGMGNRGYSILKVLRQDMFDELHSKLPERLQKLPDVDVALADAINHATGVTKTQMFRGANVALFAPRLMASRFAWLAGDPIKAARITARWLADPRNVTEGEKLFAINQVKEKAAVFGTLIAALAINEGMLQATNSKQHVNLLDPMKGDFLKFKGFDMQASYGTPMITLSRLPLRLARIAWGSRGKRKYMVYPDEDVYGELGKYVRSQASPFAGTASDLFFRMDYQKRPLPGSPVPVPRRLRAQGVRPYTLPEYATQTVLPIPFQEAAKEVWKGMGMPEERRDDAWKAFVIWTFMSGTGGRMSEDWSLETQPIQ